MNERIRKLAGQAGFETEHHKWIFANDNVGEGECHELLEKFAELIVRECGVALSPMLRDMVSRGQAYDLIKQHFGVEE